MATAAVASESQPDTECSVCHELFRDPKLLPCAHILCRHCLLSWLAANPEALCPLCRGAIAEPSEKSQTQGWEEVVDALPDDVAMAALVESTRVLSQEHVCAGCESAEAVSICLHCGDMLCTCCTRAHGKLRATRQHTVHSLAAMTAQRLAASQFAACCSHSDKPSELYCPKHGAAICHLCASSEHRACPEVMLFEKRVEELRRELSAMSAMLKAAEDNLDKAINDLDQQLEEAERKTQQSLNEISEACDRLEKSIQECRRRLTKLTLGAKQSIEESVQVTRADMLDRRGRLTSHRRVVDRVKMTSPPGKLEKAAATIRLRIRGLNLKVTLPAKVINMTTLRIDKMTLTKVEKELTFLGEERQTTVAVSEAKTWQFFPGDNIVLSNRNQTAEKIRGQTAIVMSSTPMQQDTLYEVRIDARKGKSSDIFPCGVVRSPPSGLVLPKTSLDGWTEAIVFSHSVFQYNVEKDYEIDNRLRNLKEGTRIGFVRDSGSFLHLYINGEKQWVYARNVPKESYVFFELLHVYQKVTALPLTFVKKAVKKY